MRISLRALLLVPGLALAGCGQGDRDLFGPDWQEIAATGGDATSGVEFAAVHASYAHTCALDEGGVAYCWGSNVGGAVGDGTSTDRSAPTEVAGGHRFLSIGVGEYHTCGLRTDGRAYCWGGDPLSLGPGGLTYDSLPQPVPGGLELTALAVGAFHTCGLDREGAAWCWGLNGNGQLGDSTLTDRREPVRVRGGRRFQALEAGGATCGIELDGTLYCWGRNPSDCQCTLVPQVAAPGYAFAAITVAGHACGLEEGGAAYCWGENIAGQIGDGSNRNRPDPTRVAGGLLFSSIRAGPGTTCALEGDGDAYCWGANPFGLVGNGTRYGDTRAPTAVSGGHRFRSISPGANHACAIDEDGRLWCWGWNYFGQLGDGTLEDRLVPVPVLRS